MQPNGAKADTVLEAMERILASPGFVRNERLCRLLRFIVEQKLRGNTTALKETVIGTEVFGRNPDYDTHSDPVVRMEASKLRARLGKYYAGIGAADPVRIEIPKGAYIPQWQVNGFRRRAWRFTAAAVVLGLAVAAFVLWQAARPRAKPAIAVLPFLNLSSDPDGAYFGDGLADEITGLLSRTEGLEVIARTSAFALRDARLDAREIGARLNATVLVEGSVQKSPDRLKVIVQLIRAADGKHLWANTYERTMRDVFATEEEIAASVVNALRLKLGGRRRYTDNPEAFERYLRGRYAYDQGPAGARAALRCFEEAVASDASYALAYAGIANAVLAMQMFHQLTYAEARRRAMAAVERAFQLDPALPEAYTALAEIKTWEYAWPEAERAFRRAIALNANDAQAHADLGHLVLAPQGRFEDALPEVRRALALDPLSLATNESALYTLFMAGRYRDAEDQARKLPPLPFRGLAQGLLARAISLEGRHAEAMEAMHAAERLGDRDWKPACVAARAGRREEALQKLHEQVPPARPTPAPIRRFFLIYACLGDKDRALEYAEKMYAEHEPLLPTFLTYPETAWLRTDPAFAALRERIGLPR
jgi:TolB-like protein/Flp pilus assembly protein TadD